MENNDYVYCEDSSNENEINKKMNKVLMKGNLLF